MAKSDFSFFYPLRVRWAEVDRQGIVFNGHYLTYFDVAVTEYYRAIGLPYPEGFAQHGTDLYAKKAVVEYHRSAEYDDVIEVHIRVARLGRSSLRFLLEIHRGDLHLISGELVYVNADPATRKAAPVPAFLRDAIKGFERNAPEEVTS